ncbi:MAG: aluminum activated malate transporter-domain-containing protein [Benjaminiella poitrasii]|nr:MAG: aluminum activated malate transporter-domain-containing protein [Benjaminiella poitrasii]
MESILSFFKGKKELWRTIIKCVVAYEIGTILVLIPAVYNIAGSPPYLVPLGTLFFNASGTAGSQIAGMLLNILTMAPCAVWSGLVSYFCVLYNRAYYDGQPGLYKYGAGAIGAIGFGICVFTMAYFRLKYPRLYIPALQGFTMPFFIITKGVFDTSYSVIFPVETFYPVLIGGAVALIVNLVLWPETAAKKSEKSIGQAIKSIKGVLSFVHEDLLKNDDSGVMTGDITSSTKLQNLNNKLQKDIDGMKVARQDAKYEIVVSYYPPESYKPLTSLLSHLSQNLQGFSLAIKREVRIMLEKKVKAHLSRIRQRSTVDKDHENIKQARNSAVSIVKQYAHSKPILPTTSSAALTIVNNDTFQASVLSGDTLLQGREYKIIDRLQSSIQPALKRFLHTCIVSLEQIENQLVEHKAISVKRPDEGSGIVHSKSRIDLLAALNDFKETELLLQQEYEQPDSVPSEDHFLVFTVIFTLVEFGKELIKLQKYADELVLQSNSKKWWINRIYFPRVPLKRWLSKGSSGNKAAQSFSEKVVLDNQELRLQEMQKTSHISNGQRKSTATTSADLANSMSTEENDDDDDDDDYDDDNDSLDENEGLPMSRRVGRIVSRIETNLDNDHEIFREGEDYEKQMEIEEAESVPLQQAQGKHIWNKWLYRLSKWSQYAPTRYALKFTITTELLALMAFLPIPGANELYNNNHGQWALLSAMVVFNYTVGSTALQCFYRVVATIIGAVCGYLALLAGHRNENPYVIAVLVFIFQIPMWYFLFNTPYPRIGFISILTLAVITNTGYTDFYNEAIFSPVWKRTITAFFAIIVVMLVDQLVWPVWARKSLRKSLADLLIATGIQYSRVVSLVCQENTKSYRYRSTFEECEKDQKMLTKQLRVLHEMLILASTEPRLTKGPFPIKEYSEILEHERYILHWIQHIQKTQSFITESVRRTIMTPVNSYRKEMAAAVHLYLFTLACSLRTKSSLPASLPSAEMARRMLQTKQTSGWKKNYEELCKLSAKSVANRQSAEHQVFWHTYAAGSVEVVVEQEAMGDIITRLMGQHIFKAATKNWNYYEASASSVILD